MHYFIKRQYIACFECLKEVDEEGAAGESILPPKDVPKEPSQNSMDERSEQVC
jgi:hypothetical protein